ncbi:glutathione peroxidase [Paludibacterium paludis]|uniref:Glutathione peroxidase n=1 Tax=Paludibacterium paludis TaxID=1225769 RepID=A0A918NZ59_9NEIS|nr:glutathione peroxidase [Paludibacterium paludis]GGY07950.1 glutathione peroxidase [Paludibacterium paludis]
MPTLPPLKVKRADGSQMDLAECRGKLLLLVNTASECGYTRQYAGLQELHEMFGPDRLVVLAFPCNQFGNQEPGSEAEIAAFCESRFAIRFPLMAKVDVNGPDADPLWRWLTLADSEWPQPVKWNFTKFLLDRQGRLVKRYEPVVEPWEIAEDIRALLPAR